MILRTNINIYLCNVVWGNDYIDFFLQFNIPSLLSKSNIPTLSKKTKCIFYIYTKKEYFDRINNSSAINKLRGYVELRIVVININSHDKHIALSKYHKIFLKEAILNSAVAFFLSPDTLWSDGSLIFAYNKFLDGYDCLFVPGLRVDKESATEDLRNMSALHNDVCTLSPRVLVSHALKHLHRSTLEFFYSKGVGSLMSPSVLIWKISNFCLGLRSFHQHPLFIFRNDVEFSFESTIDFELGMYLIHNAKPYYIVKDSDEMVVIEYSARDMVYSGVFPKESPDLIGNWASDSNATNALHWNLIKAVNIFRCNDVDIKLVKDFADSSNKIIENIAFHAHREMLKKELTYEEKLKLQFIYEIFSNNWLLKRKYESIIKFRKNFKFYYFISDILSKIYIYFKKNIHFVHYEFINFIIIRKSSYNYIIYIDDLDNSTLPRYLLFLLEKGYIHKINYENYLTGNISDNRNLFIILSDNLLKININNVIKLDKYNDVQEFNILNNSSILLIQKNITKAVNNLFRKNNLIIRIVTFPILIMIIILSNSIAYLILLSFRIP